MRYRVLPWLLVLLFAELAFGLACRLVPTPGDAGAGPDSGGLAGRFLSASRTGLGASVIDQADAYLHRGVGHLKHEAFTNTWFQRMAARVSVRGVMHRGGKDAGEVVPWLWFGTELDPDNVDYWLMSAYWLKASGHDELAMGAIRKALERKPRDPRLHLERARLLLRAGQFSDAARALDAALVCVTNDTTDAQITERTLQTYRGLLYEYKGLTNQAVAMYMANKGQAGELESRAADLMAGRTPTVSSADLLQSLVNAVQKCEHHDEESEEDAHGERPHE